MTMTATAVTPRASARASAVAARRAYAPARVAMPVRQNSSHRVVASRGVETVMSASKRATSYSQTSKKGLAAYVRRAETRQMKGDLIPFRVGMTVKVGVTVNEGGKSRVQPYEGVVIAIHRSGAASTVTVRKSLQGYGVERVFPVHSPLCTFEEVRGAGKPVVRIFIRSRRGDGGGGARWDADAARGGGVDGRDATGRRRRATVTRGIATGRSESSNLDTDRSFLLVFLLRAGSSRQALLPPSPRRQASAPQDALRRQEAGRKVSDETGARTRARARSRRSRRLSVHSRVVWLGFYSTHIILQPRPARRDRARSKPHTHRRAHA